MANWTRKYGRLATLPCKGRDLLAATEVPLLAGSPGKLCNRLRNLSKAQFQARLPSQVFNMQTTLLLERTSQSCSHTLFNKLFICQRKSSSCCTLTTLAASRKGEPATLVLFPKVYWLHQITTKEPTHFRESPSSSTKALAQMCQPFHDAPMQPTNSCNKDYSVAGSFSASSVEKTLNLSTGVGLHTKIRLCPVVSATFPLPSLRL